MDPNGVSLMFLFEGFTMVHVTILVTLQLGSDPTPLGSPWSPFVGV